MARIRTIKPDFWTDEKIVKLSPLARLLFIGLWNFVDDEGRMEFSLLGMKLKILPLESTDCSGEFGEIRGNELITQYEVNGKSYICVNGFEKHQKIDKRSLSRLPAPPNSPEFPRIPPTEGKGRDQGREEEGKDKKYIFTGKKVKLTQADFEKFSKTYHAIPDLRAELEAADNFYHGKGEEKWFMALGGWLNNSHQKYISRQNPPKKYQKSISPHVSVIGGSA